MSKKRQHWLDVVKGIAIILVVMGHVGSTYGGDSASHSFNVFHKLIYSFHMPLFMFVSGYLFTSSMKKNYRATALSKLATYGIPYVFFSITYWAMKTLGSAFVNNAVSFKDLFKIPLSFMWYLYALLIMIELSLLIGRKNNRTVLVVAVICRIIWETLTIIQGFADSWVNNLIVTDFIKNYIWFALGFTSADKLASRLQKTGNPVKLTVSVFGLTILMVVAAIGQTKVPFVRILWGLIGIVTIFCIGLLISKKHFFGIYGQEHYADLSYTRNGNFCFEDYCY